MFKAGHNGNIKEAEANNNAHLPDDSVLDQCKGGTLQEGEQPSLWHKSSFSGNQDCLEWTISAEGVRLRHSKGKLGPELQLTHAEWRAFLTGVKAGEADSSVE